MSKTTYKTTKKCQKWLKKPKNGQNPKTTSFGGKNDLRPFAKSADQNFPQNDHFGRFRPFLATLDERFSESHCE